MKRIPFKDLGDKTEDERIDEIGAKAINEQMVVGFIVDDEPGKPERYIRKLRKKFPGIQIVDKCMGPVPATILVKVGPRVN